MPHALVFDQLLLSFGDVTMTEGVYCMLPMSREAPDRQSLDHSAKIVSILTLLESDVHMCRQQGEAMHVAGIGSV